MARTSRRPPRTGRLPWLFPLSRAKGAKPASRYVDLEEKTLQPLDNPFGPKV